jgi:hypothetical protein
VVALGVVVAVAVVAAVVVAVAVVAAVVVAVAVVAAVVVVVAVVVVGGRLEAQFKMCSLLLELAMCN